MNIFKFEFKNILKQVLIWSLSMIAILILFSLMYTVYENSSTDVIEILRNYPPQALAAIGINIDTIFTYNGFYSFTFTYISLASAIFALYFSLTIFALEKNNNTSDFLYTKPISRKKIFFAKLITCLIALALIDILFYIVAIILFKLRAINSDFSSYLMITNTVVFLELIFLAVGVFLANVLKKVRNPGGLATLISFSFLVISMLDGILKDEKIKYISPFGYFNGKYIIENKQYEAKFIIISFAITIFLLVFAYIKHDNTDIDSV